MKRIKFTRHEFFLFLVIIFLVMELWGATLNMKVVKANEGKMPVMYSSDFFTNSHRFYSNITDANLWYLSDIIDAGIVAMSIGDIFAIAGAIGSSIYIIRFMYSKSGTFK